MKRDMDVIRKIILSVRDVDGAISSVEGIEKQNFGFHVQMLEEAKLVNSSILTGNSGKIESARILRLTWKGEDFADVIVDDKAWKKAKENIIKKNASWTFYILLEFLEFEAKRVILGFN